VKLIPIYGNRWGFPIAHYETGDIIQVWKTHLHPSSTQLSVK
jgi:hypothetical protein